MWELVASKEIVSADGVTKADYSWYTDGKLHIFMMDNQEPDPEWCDWSEDTYEGAKKWYDQCNGWLLDI